MDDDVPAGSWSIAPDLREQMRLDGIRSALEGGRPDEAILEAEELLDSEPAHLEALYLLGEALLEVGDAELARHAFESCQRHGEGEATVELTYRLGLSCFEVSDLAQAIVLLRDVLRRDPSHADAQFTLAMSYEFRGFEGDAARAMTAFEAARALDPEVYPPPMELEPSVVATALREAMGRLPGELARALSDVPITLHERPDLAELRRAQPPLPPTVLALLDGDPGDDPEELLAPTGLRVFTGTLVRYPNFDDVVVALADALTMELAGYFGLA